MSGKERGMGGLKRAIAGGVLAACCGVGAAHAQPECTADTFTGEQACIYGRKSIGLAGIGNQIISAKGRLVFRRLVSRIGEDPVDIEAVLFRVDDRRTIRLPATNATKPTISCRGFCTWSWTVAAPISGPVLRELASAEKLVIGFHGQGQTIEEAALKRGGQMFEKFLADIAEHEPDVLDGAEAEVFLMEGTSIVPYATPQPK